MSPSTKKTTKYMLASVNLQDAFTDFWLSRQALLVTPGTLRFYRFTASRFVSWLGTQGITDPAEVTARYVRAYLADLAPTLKDSTLHGHARAIKTLLRFWHDEGYTPHQIRFDMPKIADKRLPVLDADQLKTVIAACNVRDKALVMFLADTGVRRAELLSLKWDDLDMQTGAVKVIGKGRKYRVAFCGAKNRRALLKHRRETDTDRIFPLTKSGLRSALLRISKRTGIHVTPHALRRTFATIALRNGMPLPQLSQLLGHAEISTTQIYLKLLVDDLADAHRQYSPIDSL